MLKEYIRETQLPEELVRNCLESAIAEALMESLGMSECMVDLDRKVATGVFRVPEDITLEEAAEFSETVVAHDVLTMTFDFAGFPKQVVKKCAEVFPYIVLDMEAAELYRRWFPRRRTVVEGIITEKNTGLVRLALDETGSDFGVMLKPEWVQKEAALRYREGRPLLVYVLSVRRHKAAVTVYVSRQTKQLPACLLKRRVPWHEFVCIRRKPGRRCVVLTDCPGDDNTLKAAIEEAEEELGEKILIRKQS